MSLCKKEAVNSFLFLLNIFIEAIYQFTSTDLNFLVAQTVKSVFKCSLMCFDMDNFSKLYGITCKTFKLTFSIAHKMCLI